MKTKNAELKLKQLSGRVPRGFANQVLAYCALRETSVGKLFEQVLTPIIDQARLNIHVHDGGSGMYAAVQMLDRARLEVQDKEANDENDEP